VKKLLITVLILTLSLMADLHWQKDLPTAFDLAKKEHKKVMVFVEGKHCRWCKKMKHRILSDESVEKRLASFVLVKVDQEDEEAVKTLPQIDGVPTIFFMTAEKTVLEKVIGYFDVFDFTSYIDSAEKK